MSEIDENVEEYEDDTEDLATPEEMKAEAVARMKLIGIYPETINQFQNDNLVSESVPPVGACYWVNDQEKEIISKFENDFPSVVYHVIHSYTNLGEMLSLCYVTNYKSEWELDREDIEAGQMCAQVENLDAPELSEIGAIGFEIGAAGGCSGHGERGKGEMILHFHARNVRPGEIDRINIGFDWQNYNCDNYPKSDYIEVSREDLFKILQECDFNCYWYNKDLTAVHNETPAAEELPFN